MQYLLQIKIAYLDIPLSYMTSVMTSFLPIVNLLFLISYLPISHVNGVFVSQLCS